MSSSIQGQKIFTRGVTSKSRILHDVMYSSVSLSNRTVGIVSVIVSVDSGVTVIGGPVGVEVGVTDSNDCGIVW